jgi:hypothetical protein
MMRYSDDGGFTWSIERWAKIGQQGEYKNRCRWPGPLGSSRDRIFEVTSPTRCSRRSSPRT